MIESHWLNSKMEWLRNAQGVLFFADLHDRPDYLLRTNSVSVVPNTNPHSAAYSYSLPKLYPFAYVYTNTFADPKFGCYSCSQSESDFGSSPKGYPQSDSHAYTYCHCNSNPRSNILPNSNLASYRNANRDSYT